MVHDPLLTTLLDLDAALGSPRNLIIGGGYGLYLKQLHLNASPQIRALFAPSELPIARATEDIDLILRAEIATDSNSMKLIRDALDQLNFVVVDTARYTQFVRPMSPGRVKIDLLAAPLGEFATRVQRDRRRVKPKPSVNLHASKLEEALAVDRDAIRIPIEGRLSSGVEHCTEVLVPQGFSYLLMKLFAFHDRFEDSDRSSGQHHALDIYRSIAMLTEDEYENVRQLFGEFANHPVLIKACRIARKHFASADGIGRLRIKEHPLYTSAMDLDRLGNELEHLLSETP